MTFKSYNIIIKNTRIDLYHFFTGWRSTVHIILWYKASHFNDKIRCNNITT